MEQLTTGFCGCQVIQNHIEQLLAGRRIDEREVAGGRAFSGQENRHLGGQQPEQRNQEDPEPETAGLRVVQEFADRNQQGVSHRSEASRALGPTK
jgi:hypothetical protein